MASPRSFTVPRPLTGLFAAAVVVGIQLLEASTPPVEPAQPQVWLDSAYPATGGDVIEVHAGDDLQAAIDRAIPGDTLVLEAGATFTGSFVLPEKSGEGWIVIRTSGLAALPPEGRRVGPSDAPAMARIVTTGSWPAFATALRAHHYRLVGLEVAVAEGVALNYQLVALGDHTAAQSTLADVAHDLVIDRCYIHGWSGGELRRGIMLSSARTSVVDSYIADFHALGPDTQAIAGGAGPGPYKIVNNYLEAAGENVMFGGLNPWIPGLVPSDIEFRRNLCSRPLSWRGNWTVKNLFELKNARRVLIEGNVFENNWLGADQDGSAVLFTPRNSNDSGADAPWSTVQDVTFVRNLVRHSGAGVNIMGWDNHSPLNEQTARIAIRGNVFDDLDAARWGGTGRFLLITEAKDITVDHNTVLQSGQIGLAWDLATTAAVVSPGFTFTNNLVAHNEWGFFGDGVGYGNAALAHYFADLTFARNLFVRIFAGVPDAADYPADTLYAEGWAAVRFVDHAGGNYRLAEDSPYRSAGSDGRDIGADIPALEAALAAAPTPAPSPSPTPTPVPTPTPEAGAVTVVEDGDPVLSSAGSWLVNANAIHTADHAIFSMDPSARVTLTFDGTGVTWIGYQDAWSGMARVSLDGNAPVTVDTYSSTGDKRRAVVYSVSGLPLGTHTFVIEVTGEKNPASAAPWVWIDAFEVQP